MAKLLEEQKQQQSASSPEKAHSSVRPNKRNQRHSSMNDLSASERQRDGDRIKKRVSFLSLSPPSSVRISFSVRAN